MEKVPNRDRLPKQGPEWELWSSMPAFYLLLATNSGMSPRSSMPEFYLLLDTNSNMSPRSSMSKYYLLLPTNSDMSPE